MKTILKLNLDLIFAISLWKKEIVNTFRVDINIIDVCLKSQKIKSALVRVREEVVTQHFLEINETHLPEILIEFLK